MFDRILTALSSFLFQLSAKTSGSDELTELNSKLKKTISERDLLIREYKNVKDSNTAMEKELTSSKLLVENKDKEIEQLKAQTTTTTPVANGDKDAEIKVMNLLGHLIIMSLMA